MWAGLSCFLSSGDGYVGDLLELQQVFEGPLEFPDISFDWPRDPSAEMGLILPGGENLLDFLELWQVLSRYVGNSGTHSGGLRKGQSPFELLGGLSGFFSRRCQDLRPCVDSVPEPEDSSPVLTWILGYFWSLPRGVSLRLEWGHARGLSSRAVAAVSRFHSLGSRDLWLSHEAFPQGCPTCHRGVSRSSA